MEKIRGKKITSYCIFIVLLIVILLVLMPETWLWDKKRESESVRIMHKDNAREADDRKEEPVGVAFGECRLFGIKKLIKDYYDAYILDGDEEILKYIDTFGNMNLLEREFAREHVEQYMDISCYSMEGSVEGSYLVLSYGYAKYYGIDTTVPVIGTFFVRTNSSGSYYICNSVISNESSAYNEVMFNGRPVQELREMAQYELDTACEVDMVLKAFVEAHKDYFVY